MKAAAIVLVLAGSLMMNNAVFAQTGNDDLAAAYSRCMTQIQNIAMSQDRKIAHCTCLVRRSTTGEPVSRCMVRQLSESEWARHEGGYKMFYCTETEKRPDRPDYHYVFKNKYFFPRIGKDHATFCTEAWDYEFCLSARIEETQGSKKIIPDKRSAETIEEVFTIPANPASPPSHRLVSPTATSEGTCEIFDNYEGDWPDRSSDPVNKSVEVVCTQAGGSGYCVPGRYAPDDRAFIDTARVEREDMCFAQNRSQPNAVLSIYCNCVNMKMAGQGATSLITWEKANPEPQAECKRQAGWR